MAKKKKWKKTKVQLPADHGWQAAPGNKVFVADRGAMQFEVPGDWTIKPGEKGSIRFFDRKKEADADIRLEVSLIYAPNIDWSGLPLPQLVEDAALSGDSRGLTNSRPLPSFPAAPPSRGLTNRGPFLAGWKWTSLTKPRTARRTLASAWREGREPMR